MQVVRYPWYAASLAGGEPPALTWAPLRLPAAVQALRMCCHQCRWCATLVCRKPRWQRGRPRSPGALLRFTDISSASLTGGAVPLVCRQPCGRRAERAHLGTLLSLPATVPDRRGVGDVAHLQRAAGGPAAAITLGVAATPLELCLRLQLLPHGELFPRGGSAPTTRQGFNRNSPKFTEVIPKTHQTGTQSWDVAVDFGHFLMSLKGKRNLTLSGMNVRNISTCSCCMRGSSP